jgi:Fe-S-cluster containining protein
LKEIYLNAKTEEFETARAEIRRKSPIEALEASLRRMDRMISNAMAKSDQKTACTKGCSYCCYFRIDLRAHEALLIMEHIRKRLSRAQINEIIATATENSAQIRKLTLKEHMSRNFQCPFLSEGACLVYPVRPLKCRNFHATDNLRCKKSYDEPHNLSVPNSFIPEAHAAGNGHADGFVKAAENEGYDPSVYELNTAILEAISDSIPMKRYRRNKRAFLTAFSVA